MEKNKFKLKDFLTLINQANNKKLIFVLGLILSLATTGSSLLLPQLTRSLIDTAQLAKIDRSMLLALLSLFAVQLLLGALGGFFLRLAGETTVANLRNRVWRHLIRLPISYFDEHKSGEISSRLVNDTMIIKELVSGYFPSFITGMIQLVGALVILFLTDWKMAALIFTVVPIVVLIMVPIGAIMVKLGKALQQTTADFNGEATEKLGEIRLIKASNGEEVEEKRGAALIQRILDVSIKEAKVSALLQPIMSTAIFGMFIGILGYGAIRVQAGTLSTGTLVAFLLYLFNILMPAASFPIFFTQVQKARGATERIQELLNTPKEDFASGEDINITGKSVSVIDVDFSYEEGRQVLQEVSFSASPNSVIAFAGPSGGGKSTIFSLLERFYPVDNGEINVANEAIENINLHSWRRQVGYVSQDSAIFSGSIRDNLQYGLKETLSDDELWRGLELAYANHFVSDFPEKLETEVGERGVKLSGGQKQRLAIARAFLRDPKILMLDEATASLDSKSEEQVQRALEHLMEGRTAFVIAHRLSTIVDADQIYFVENGKITGSGTHQELLENHPLYGEYVKEQVLA
ncbi:ABC transporter ATP-binding protein [Vagococcus elongatus]|uniref:Multidrug resistance ABC transporter ATP-binding and permease protein n=1 Tax=Vagococcus elongatus TaxID=180344 RepID=A0A430B5H8_9ENTE|nr:ABC transporter ATP-binding protein [Vagococcus elongatus]RSU15527.1 multidrug ABC transporter permease [Vagococcus elongatus]